MIKKLTIITLSAFLLGGCTLSDLWTRGNAALDVSASPIATTTPAPTSSPKIDDPELQAMPSNSSNNDDKSLETDINNTKVLNEDFSNLN